MCTGSEPTRAIRLVLHDGVWTAREVGYDVEVEAEDRLDALRALDTALAERGIDPADEPLRGRHEGEAVERFRQHREEERERDSLSVEDEPLLEGQLVFKGPVEEAELGSMRRR